MSVDIVDLLVKSLISLIYGTILLIVALVILPDKVLIVVLKIIKPDLVLKSKFMARVRLVLDYVFNIKDVVISSSEKRWTANRYEEEIRDLINQKRIIEGNLFFLDLLQNLAGMLYYSVSLAGYGDRTVCDLLGSSMSYLQYYSKQFKKTAESSRHEAEVIYMAAERLQSAVNDSIKFLQEQNGEDEFNIVKSKLKGSTAEFDSFMKDKFESTKKQLGKTNQLLANKLIEYIQIV